MAAPLRLKTALWRMGWRVRDRLAASGPRHPIHLAARTLRGIGPLRFLWKRYVFKPDTVAIGVEAYANAGGRFNDTAVAGPSPGPPGEDFDAIFQVLVQRADRYETPYRPRENSALIVNCGLSAGGAERQILNTLNGLRRRGVAVDFLGEYMDTAPGLDFHLPSLPPDVGAGAPKRVTELGLDLYASVTRPVAEALQPLPEWMVFEILDMVGEIRRARPAAVHLWQDQTSIKHGIAAVIAGAPRVVLSGRNVNPTFFDYFQPWLAPGYRALAASPRVVLTNNSAAGSASYADWLEMDVADWRVIRNGADFSKLSAREPAAIAAFRSRCGAADGQPLIGGVNRLSQEKRPLLWVAAAAALVHRRPDARFVIAGDGPLRAETEAEIERLGLRDRLLLLGESRETDLLFQAIDAFVMTSVVEGTPNAMLEAQWFGAPCVTTPAGGAAETLDPGVTGLVVEPPEPEAIAAAVETVLAPEWRTRARAAGPEFVRTRFGVETMIDQTLAVYFGPV